MFSLPKLLFWAKIKQFRGKYNLNFHPGLQLRLNEISALKMLFRRCYGLLWKEEINSVGLRETDEATHERGEAAEA